MTKILLAKKNGALSCSAREHAGFAKKGSDIVCAAITVLLRTAMQTLGGTAEIDFETSLPSNGGEKPERGELDFCARVKESLAAEQKAAAKIKIDFLAEYLHNGFKSLVKEFPKNISFEYKLEE